MSFLKEYFVNLNLFKPSPNSNEVEDDQTRRWNLITTRLYIIVLILSLIGIGLYLSLINQTTLIKMKYPTKEQFEKLPANARCSCSQISFPYGKFISLETNFHEVCSSDFVSDRWF